MWILTPVNIWGLRGKRSSYTKTVCRNILCLSGANACEEAISAPKTKLINFWGRGDDFLCHHILLLSPTALINPADRVLMLKWNAENVLFFYFYLHLDAGDPALVSPVHGVGHISAWCPSKGRWRPLDVSGRTECGERLQDLLWCLWGGK